MKTRKITHEISNGISFNKLDVSNLRCTENLFQPIWVAVVMSISLGFVTPVSAENTGAVDIQHYRNTNESTSAQDKKVENSISLDKSSKTESVKRPEDGTFPAFAQVDIDDDHYLTKEELKNFPYMLKVFDLIDAGKDGKLEQHEYQNLEMETKR
ncbi:conserved hypothetical protein [Crenothrix polyspora]|uniref:EF-hand domain-containing protein n=1 Tax=Crenothrix polyspora TaxID=360316 RepID=A0A1R4GZE7_9GAMM|nr:EF-hand domain-containing protein [Crenothrix polyspora]SJM89332.1 conserved hypothetical protein [Crenothrix polyspora]